MKYPKLPDGPNPVGEAKVRHLQTLDAPFLTAIGPGFVASKMGEFYEVTGAQESHQVVEDGWYSFTRPAAGIDVQVKATDAPQKRFRTRGTFANPNNTSSLFATGGGWAFALEAELDNPIAGYVLASFSKSRSGRPSNTTLIQSTQLIDIYETKASNSGWYGTFYQNQPVIWYSGAWFTTRLDGVLRQEPRLSIYFETSPAAWVEYQYDITSLIADGESYTYAQAIILTPDIHMMWTAAFGDQLPTLYSTDDYGATWTACPALPDIYPGRGVWAFDTRATIQAAHPAWTGQQVEDWFVTQQDGTEELAWDSHVWITAIAADRILIESRFLKAAVPHDPVSAVSLVDPYTGVLKWQKFATMANELQYYEAWPTQLGSWLVSRRDSAGVYFDEMYLLEDFGATETALTIPANIVSLLAPRFNRVEAGPANTDPPSVYFIVDDAGERVLYRTDDYFTTNKKRGVIGPVVNSEDFTEVIWVGTRQDRAPIDPTFPWRTDNRVTMPDWWTNVTAYGG
jgi:hypothetical protein